MGKEKEKIPLVDMPIHKSLLILSIPIIIANILQVAYQFTDSFWVGRIGANAVATTTFSGIIVFLSISIGSGFAIAGSILIAQYYGAKNKKMVNIVAAQSLLMIIFTSIILGTIGFIATPYIMNLMNIDQAIYSQTLNFIRLSFVGIIFNFSFFMFQSIMRGIGKPNIPIFIVLMTVILNFILDPLFIFGYGIFPAFGVIGAAIATLITQSLASIIGFIVLFSGKYEIQTKLTDYKPNFEIIKKSFLLGLPSSIEMTSRSLGYAIMTGFVTLFGTVALAAYGIAGNVNQFIVIFAMGFSMAVSILVGQNIGAGNIEKAKKVNKIGITIGFLMMTLSGIISFIFAPYLIKFFIPEDLEVINIGANYLYIVSLFFGFVGIQMSINGVLRAIGKTKIPMIMTILGLWIFRIPLAYYLSTYTNLGLSGIWWSEPIANGLICIITFFVFIKLDWKKVNLTKQEEIQKEIIEETIIEEGIKA